MLSQNELDAHGEPYITGQWFYLERCIKWLKKYNITAIIDLHAAPGSQNPWDNSGHQTDKVDWGTGDTINRTLDVIERLAIGIAQWENSLETSHTVVGLELLNEPFPERLQGGLGVVRDYYLRAYPVVRRHLPAHKYRVIIEMAFCLQCWGDFMQPPQYQNVFLDLHIYQCFDSGLRAAPYEQHLTVACNSVPPVMDAQTLPTFVGEWSVAFKEESGWAQYEPYPNATDMRHFMLQFALSQMKVYGSFFFWNFKTETAPMWDYFLGVEGGWLPSKLDSIGKELVCGGHSSSSLPLATTTSGTPSTELPSETVSPNETPMK